MRYPALNVLFAAMTSACLIACGGNDPTITDSTIVYAPAPYASADRQATPGQAASATPVVLASSATESERQADAMRMIEMEQAQSLEMNRRHAEQVEREERIAANRRAGVQQSPGCEDTVGHEAVVCEQRVTQL